ncbi:MAG: thioredoxin domain-containing protein [Acidobacteriota bacterium]
MQNRLGAEKSPYLLQHRHNPVNWQPWDDAAFAEARRRDVPVFLSIGYSTCHWCHVMERESFESEALAAVLNQHFVAIKVDREERPDIDALYMEATQAMTGHGGWPMSVWLTHDRKPFFCGTYFPPDRFAALLRRIAEIWRDDRNEVLTQGEALMQAMANAAVKPGIGTLDDQIFLSLAQQWRERFDPVHGGFRGAPKFPQAADLRALLRLHRRSDALPPLAMVRTTLDAMARGGIYDHLGGGFARYSVDAEWLVPHFEKMLYDQASLALAYLEAWQLTDHAEYALVVRETLDYVLRDMTHNEGAFYSAEDADSEGEEGKFYIWTADELKSLLGPAYGDFAATFGVSDRGNFEHNSTILTLQPGHSRTDRSAALRQAQALALQRRSQRVRPHLDDKILTDWNGLMIGALARASWVLQEPRYLQAAQRAATFVLATLRKGDGRLLHRWRDGEARIPGFIDDYAFLIQALLDLHEADFDKRWVDVAIALQTIQDNTFFDSDQRDYRFSDGSDLLLPLRRFESYDGVVPAGRSVSALNLQRLAAMTGDTALLERADALLSSTPHTIQRAPTAFAQLLHALDYRLDRSKSVAVLGQVSDPLTRELIEAVRQGFQPNVSVIAGKQAESVPWLVGQSAEASLARAFVCEHGACLPPTSDPQTARRQAISVNPIPALP